MGYLGSPYSSIKPMKWEMSPQRKISLRTEGWWHFWISLGTIVVLILAPFPSCVPHVSCYFDCEHLPAAGGVLIARSPGGRGELPLCPVLCLSVLQHLFVQHWAQDYATLKTYNTTRVLLIKTHCLIFKEKNTYMKYRQLLIKRSRVPKNCHCHIIL